MTSSNPRIRQGFLVHGAALFLAGLMLGAFVSKMANPRMGLSAHLALVQSGMFLLALGAGWAHARLSAGLERVTYALTLGGMYGLSLALVMAAVWGTGRSTPIAGAGFAAAPWKESFVEILLVVSSLAAVVAGALVLLGFLRGRAALEA
jgi:hydroxylaminobenzene mutase